jgi:hypothetical protein
LQVAAVRDGRKLLDDPDPVPPLADALTKLLRKKVQSLAKAYAESHAVELKRLKESRSWTALDQGQQTGLLTTHRLDTVPQPSLGSEEEVLQALASTSLSSWDSQILALPARFGAVLEAAAKVLAPKAHRVSLPSRTLESETHVDEWLAEAREILMKELKKGPVIP